MPANFQRFLPILLLVFLLLFVLPAILHKKHSSGLTSQELSQETIAAMNIVVAGQKSFAAEHAGRYTGHVADLIQGSRKLAKYIADGVLVQVDASTNGKTFYSQVASGVIVLNRSQTGNVVLAKSCDVIKSGKGVECPGTGAKTTSSTTTTTTTATTAG